MSIFIAQSIHLESKGKEDDTVLFHAKSSAAKEALGKQRKKEVEAPQFSFQLEKQANKIYCLIWERRKKVALYVFLSH